jgi:uncharacterized protein (DUF2336 family)
MNFSLTAQDVQKLLTDPSAENRSALVAKVGHAFSGRLNERERHIAEDIFQVMVRDAEVRVRKALAQSLKSNPDIPRDIAIAMAHDVADVAVPILESSEVLTTEDLVEIIRTRAPEHQMAVARRRDVNETVADALVETRNEDVVATLVANADARIAPRTMTRVVDEFGHLEKVQQPLVARRQMPVQVVERLMTMVSESLRDQLVANHNISPEAASALVSESRERAVVDLLDREDVDTEELVRQLHVNGRLTATLMTRALCMGDTIFFEAALARLAGIPMSNVYTLIHDKGDLGLKSLFQKCHLPMPLMGLCRAAIQVAEETNYDGLPNDRQRFRDRMIERVLTMSENIHGDDLDYLISKMASNKVPYRPLA